MAVNGRLRLISEVQASHGERPLRPKLVAEPSYSQSESGSASQVCPISSTSTPRLVSIFMNRAMTVCSSACNFSPVDAVALMKVAAPSAPHRYTPSSSRQCRTLPKLDELCSL